jgi:hypothetical protein
MTATEFHGFTRCMNPPDKWRDQDAKCIPLYIRDYFAGETPLMESVWTFSPEEREAIAHGADIALAVVGTIHPPVALRISEYRVLDETPFNNWK